MALSAEQRADLVRKAEDQLEAGEVVDDVTLGALHVPDGRRPGRTRARAMSVLATDRRLLFFRTRWGGHEVHTLRYDQIAAVDHTVGRKLGELRLTVPGRDVVLVSSVPRDDVERFVALITTRLAPG